MSHQPHGSRSTDDYTYVIITLEEVNVGGGGVGEGVGADTQNAHRVGAWRGWSVREAAVRVAAMSDRSRPILVQNIRIFF
jgi:hypothetical protein